MDENSKVFNDQSCLLNLHDTMISSIIMIECGSNIQILPGMHWWHVFRHIVAISEILHVDFSSSIGISLQISVNSSTHSSSLSWEIIKEHRNFVNGEHKLSSSENCTSIIHIYLQIYQLAYLCSVRGMSITTQTRSREIKN